MTTILRALRRAEFPLEYSKGFHPSPRISFGPPLGVGISGLSEYFDLEIFPPLDLVSGRKKLNTFLPEGIYIKEMAVIPRKTASLSRFITRYEYEISGGDTSSVSMFLAEEVIEKDRRKQIVNLRDMVEDVRFIKENSIKLVLVDQDDIKVRLGELLPVLLGAPMEKLDITRLALYGWDGGWMKPLDTLLKEVVDYK
jgi:radical SAM-linked protein